MLTASTTLIFVALLGGVVKLLLDDVQRGRERRDEQLRFVTALLADCRSVYDRVERVRILVAAHRSALTYGNEMRELIDSAVQLRNVKRALDSGTSGIREQQLSGVRLCIESMEKYLNSLIDEFTTRYKPIADKQQIYEAMLTAQVKEAATALNRTFAIPENDAWLEILTLPRLKEFRDADSRQDAVTTTANSRPLDYWRSFVGALDLASWLLRTELRHLRRAPQSNIPEALQQVLDQLRDETVEDERR